MKSSEFMGTKSYFRRLAGQAAAGSLPLPEDLPLILHHIFDACEGENLLNQLLPANSCQPEFQRVVIMGIQERPRLAGGFCHVASTVNYQSIRVHGEEPKKAMRGPGLFFFLTLQA
ncbi:MAG: hypothetical protein ABSF90_14695 [Syntrophobacteraceae bacterium]|jgi:hypothetical protein